MFFQYQYDIAFLQQCCALGTDIFMLAFYHYNKASAGDIQIFYLAANPAMFRLQMGFLNVAFELFAAGGAQQQAVPDSEL